MLISKLLPTVTFAKLIVKNIISDNLKVLPKNSSSRLALAALHAVKIKNLKMVQFSEKVVTKKYLRNYPADLLLLLWMRFAA